MKLLKLLDRYLLDLFTNALVLFLLAFIGLSLVFDFVTHLDDLLSIEDAGFLQAMKYFLYKIPLYLYMLLPPITLFATIFTSTRLMTTNELVPIITAGISIKRVVVPFLVSSLAIGGIIFTLDEWVLPRISNKLGELEGIVKSENFRYNITAMDGRGNYLFAKQYEVRKRKITDIIITVIDPEGRKVKTIFAASARWEKKPGQWILSNGSIRPYAEGVPIVEEDPSGQKQPVIKEASFGPDGHVLDSDLHPSDISASGMIGPGYMTLKEILQKAEKYPHAPTFWIRLHQKLTYPLSPLILIFIGIPFVIRGGHKGILQGLITCLLITILYYGFTFGLIELGNKMIVGPILASWLPTLVFGGTGIFLFATKTD